MRDRRERDLKMKFVLEMFRVATTITKGKAEITFRKRRSVSIFQKRGEGETKRERKERREP
jgi:hypothetical protein